MRHDVVRNMSTELIPCCIFLSFFADKSIVKNKPGNSCTDTQIISIIAHQFLVVTQEELSKIHPTELKHPELTKALWLVKAK